MNICSIYHQPILKYEHEFENIDHKIKILHTACVQLYFGEIISCECNNIPRSVTRFKIQEGTGRSGPLNKFEILFFFVTFFKNGKKRTSQDNRLSK